MGLETTRRHPCNLPWQISLFRSPRGFEPHIRRRTFFFISEAIVSCLGQIIDAVVLKYCTYAKEAAELAFNRHNDTKQGKCTHALSMIPRTYDETRQSMYKLLLCKLFLNMLLTGKVNSECGFSLIMRNTGNVPPDRCFIHKNPHGWIFKFEDGPQLRR